MSRPQQPELARSAKTDLDPDHVETGLQGQKKPAVAGETGPVPADNQPGHHPPKEQDKPDLDAFAARLGTDPKAPTATNARKGARPAKAATAKKAPPAKATPAKGTPAKSAPAKSASRPAATAPKKSPAAPPKVQATPAKRPAAAPTAWPESAPSREKTAQIAAPQPQPRQEQQPQGRHGDTDGERESRLVALAMLPLRETVKRLEQLDEKLSDRLNQKVRSMRGSRR